MALQHPPLLPHVKEKQIGLLNSCQAKWGCTENKQKGNWIRGRVHATLNKSTDLRFSQCNWTKDFEDEFWGWGSQNLGKKGQVPTLPQQSGSHPPQYLGAQRWRYPSSLSNSYLYFSRTFSQCVKRKKTQAVPCPPPSGKMPSPRPSQASVLNHTISPSRGNKREKES